MVGEKGRFYLSVAVFAGGGGRLHTLHPTKTRWAEYRPVPPHGIRFGEGGEDCAPRVFTDIDWLGYAIRSTGPHHDGWVPIVEIKLGAFEAEAVVNRPAADSEMLALARLAGEEPSVPPFLVGRTEVPYALYQKIHRWASSSNFAERPGYVFDGDPQMGSMELCDRTYGADEPVTGITWLDAAAWCNALSEYEGFDPVYFTEPACTGVFRTVRDRFRFKVQPFLTLRDNEARLADGTNSPVRVYPRWEANGYRLPTPDEWLAPADAAPATDPGAAQSSTHPVGATPADAAGLHDVTGNVWEYIWDAGEAYDPVGGGTPERHTVVGGDFAWPERRSASPYGDEPWKGAYNIGFRVVPRAPGLSAPKRLRWDAEPAAGGRASARAASATGASSPTARGGRNRTPTDAPAWSFAKGEHLPSTAPVATALGLRMRPVPGGTYAHALDRRDSLDVIVSPFELAETEVTYRKWTSVRQWGVAHGYAFNYGGDMGSMYSGTGAREHGAEEPVTRICWHDAVAWCNALSEMEGRQPCYYRASASASVIPHFPLDPPPRRPYLRASSPPVSPAPSARQAATDVPP